MYITLLEDSLTAIVGGNNGEKADSGGKIKSTSREFTDEYAKCLLQDCTAAMEKEVR